jgi:hypothetical protein
MNTSDPSFSAPAIAVDQDAFAGAVSEELAWKLAAHLHAAQETMREVLMLTDSVRQRLSRSPNVCMAGPMAYRLREALDKLQMCHNTIKESFPD